MSEEFGRVRESAMLIASALITGLGLGSMYGLLALGFHVTYAVSRTVNFAQGSTMMLGAVLCFTFWVTLGWPLRACGRRWRLRPARCGASWSSAWRCGRSCARLEFLADGDRRARHRARERGAVHLRQGPARHAVRRSDHRRGHDRRRARSSICRFSIPVVGLALAAGAAAVLSQRRGTARRCSRWCRTRMRRG